MIKPVFSLMLVSALSITSATLFADPAKCSPCQAAKSIRDELKQSIKDAAAAALAAGGAFSREQELDTDSVCSKCGCSRTTRDEYAQDVEKCGCGKPRTTRDEFIQNIEAGKCGCGKPRTTRDEVAQIIEQAAAVVTVPACCEFCAEPGSLGCQGKNAFRCNTCQQGLVKMSRAEAAQEILEAAQCILENELDEVPGVSRAPREELADPCDPCGSVPGCELNPCSIEAQLKALRCCCQSLTQRVSCHAAVANKHYRKLRDNIDDVEDVLGDPAAATFLDIPRCSSLSATDALINSTDADVMTWLKSIYELLYRVHSCVCCIE